MIVAHAHDLDGSVKASPEIVEDGRRELDRPWLARNMRRRRVMDEPFAAAVDPDIQTVAAA